MEDIRRKRGDYKAAVEKLAAGHVAEGLDRLDTMGAIKPMPAADLYGMQRPYHGTPKGTPETLIRVFRSATSETLSGRAAWASA